MTEPIRLCDLAALDRELGHDLRAVVDRVARTGQLVLGEAVASFERALAAHHGVAEAVGVGSGSDALLLALRAVGVGAGDVVITTPLSFVATAEAILRAGARPRFVDVDEAGLLSAQALGESLARDGRAGAVLPVHLYGRACDGVGRVAAEHHVPIVHDAAQAVGMRVDGAPLGSDGPACLSFFPSKNLGAWGDGGAVLTDDPDIAREVRRGRVHGRGEDGRYGSLGLNSRLDAIQAAVLETKLSHLADHEARRRAVVARYREALGGLERVILPPPLRHEDTCHLFTIRVIDGRASLQRRFVERGIESRVYYPRLLADEPVVTPHRAGDDPLPVARQLAGEVLSIPAHPHMDEAAVARVITAIRRWHAEPRVAS